MANKESDNVKPAFNFELSVDELSALPTERMKEYMLAFREGFISKAAQVEELTERLREAEKRNQYLIENFRRYQTAAKNQVNFCKDTILQAYKTVLYMQPLEDINI